MINLIPKEEKNKMVRGFYYRLAIIYLLALSFPIFIGLVVMIPSYFMTYIKEDLVDKKLEAQENEPVPVPDQETLATIQDLDKKLYLIENVQKDKFVFSERVVNAVILKKMPAIKITGISYEINYLTDSETEEVTVSKKINVSGLAPSREALLLFRRALEDDSNFKSVDLPISNFVKGSNIQFYLSLTPAK